MFCFVKKKTAYEMRMSDWSSDVCSSDLLEAALGSAVVLDDDGVLGDVDQTARQVAGVGGLQRGIGQALAGAVGGVEVLQHGEAFLEVRDDRRLDDLARRLGHQAAHAGELLDLRRRATGDRKSTRLNSSH